MSNTLKPIEQAHEIAYDIKQLASLLASDVEWSFDRGRWRQRPCGSIDMTFQEDGIETTEWLTGRVYMLSAKLQELLLNMVNDATDTDYKLPDGYTDEFHLLRDPPCPAESDDPYDFVS